jgi:hypothetical protein
LRWSIKHVPDCASICHPDFIPEAPYDTDLDLIGIIPIKNKTQVKKIKGLTFKINWRRQKASSLESIRTRSDGRFVLY